MLLFRSFINFFMVPVLCIVIMHRKSLEEIKFSLYLFLQYCVIVCLNIPLTRVFTFFGRIFLGAEIEADSSYYTICALLAAVLMAMLKEIYSNRKK